MLAGVAGIDFVVFVIAADESIKPQTREHFEICRLLRIRSGSIALTKSRPGRRRHRRSRKARNWRFVEGSFLGGSRYPSGQRRERNGAGGASRRNGTPCEHTGIRDTSQQFRLSGRSILCDAGLWHRCHRHCVRRAWLSKMKYRHIRGPGLLRVRGMQVHGRTMRNRPSPDNAPQSTSRASNSQNSPRHDAWDDGRFCARDDFRRCSATVQFCQASEKSGTRSSYTPVRPKFRRKCGRLTLSSH